MLQFIRDRAQGFVVGVIVLFICLTFALWGVEEYLGAGAAVVVAEVNGDEVELPEFQRMFQRLRQQAQLLFEDQFDPAEWSGEAAKLSTLEQVVDERLLLGLADDSNMRISDRQVAEQIRNSEQFQNDDGQFSAQTYSTLVNYMGFSEIGFEQQMRRDLLLNQLRTGVAGTAFVTEREAKIIERLRNQKRDIGYAVIPIETYSESANPSEKEIEAHYQSNLERYRVPEKAALEYVTLSIEQLMKDVSPNEQSLVEYYEAHPGNYAQDERRNANHILIQIRRDAPELEDKAALEKAKQIRELALASDASFEEIAKEYSDDIGSKTEGGETGMFGLGVMAPEFEQAVFSMNVGEVSEPIRTDFGYHIVKLKEIDPGGLQSYEQARNDVEEQYRREQAEAIYYEQAEQLSDLAYEHPDSLDAIKDALALEVKRTALLTEEELALSLAPQAVTRAFETETLIEGLNSEPVETPSGDIIVVRVANHEASRIPTLDEIRTQVVDEIKNQNAQQAIEKLGNILIERLTSGEDPKSVFEAEGLSWQEETAQGRNSTKVNRAVLRAALQAAIPDGADHVYIGVPIGSGDFAVARVANVSYPEDEELATSDVKAVQSTLVRNRVIGDWRNFVKAMRDGAEIELYPANL